MMTKKTSAPVSARSNKQVRPTFPALDEMPTDPESLFRALAITVKAEVDQPDPSGVRPSRRQEYAVPWAGFQSWRDARLRLTGFEQALQERVSWVPFNDSTSNDGPMSLNAFPGRAFIERVTNEGDACLEAKALGHSGPMPPSPGEAAEMWFGLGSRALAENLDDDQVRELAKKTVTVTGFVGEEDHKDSIFDARDYGIGLSAEDMPRTILSLNRGNKKSKRWLTGKHGQGASSTYQYSDLTLIASRRVGSPKVAFTLVEASWDTDGDGVTDKTPTYKYLVVDGKVPEIEVPEHEFPAGTLVRHIGYTAADLLSALGENSLYGLLMRSLAEPLFPVWLEVHSLKASGKFLGYPWSTGFRQYGRSIRGSVNALERARARSLEATTEYEEEPENGLTESIAEPAPDASESSGVAGAGEGTRILHRASEYFDLPRWDFGGRSGVADLGRVKITYWVADPVRKTKAGVTVVREWRDILRNWVDPDKTVLMTLDGQTHAEESRIIVTGAHGAKLWAVGKYMVVQIDCNGLTPQARYEMFTSTREHAKETPIKKMILEELVRRLSFDAKLAELNVRLAAADIKQPENAAEQIASMIKKYLKNAGISFEQLTRKVEKWVETEEEQKVPAAKPPAPPIPAVDPPTFIRWKFKGTSVSMFPGQRYSFVFETDASAYYWNPGNQAASKIKVTAHGVRYVGAGEIVGGRVRCHFECPPDVRVGAEGFIQAQLEYVKGAALTAVVPVLVVERPAPKAKPKPKADDDDKQDKEGPSKAIRVKVRRKDFSEVEIPVVTPQPVRQTDPPWSTLGWPHDPHKVGFSIRQLGGKIQLYYNAEFPPFLDMKRRMTKRSLEDEFVRRYEMKLVLHTIFTLNYDFIDEEEFGEEQRMRVRNLLCATAESLALATKSELEIEAKTKSEDNASFETPVAANLDQVTEQVQDSAIS